MTGKLKPLCLLAAMLLSTGCSVQRAASIPTVKPIGRFPELELKERLLHEAGSQAAPLTARRSVRGGQGAEFVVPAGIAYSETGDLYVTDNNTHTLHLWRARSPLAEALKMPPGENQLQFPTTVRVWKGKVHVSDNDGIKILSAGGQFERLIRPYFGIFNFAITNGGTIIASVTIRNPGAQAPLMVELGQGGRVIREIGSRGAVTGGDGRDGQAFIAVSEKLLVAAYKYRPVVEVYDLATGKLIRQLEINHPVFASLRRESGAALSGAKADVDAKAESNLAPRYVAGVKVLGNRILLCLHLPAPEVWEMDEKGKVLAQYRASGLPRAIHVFGFDAQVNGDERKIAVGVVAPTWDASVYELNATSE
jgi:hypothetical protein